MSKEQLPQYRPYVEPKFPKLDEVTPDFNIAGLEEAVRIAMAMNDQIYRERQAAWLNARAWARIAFGENSNVMKYLKAHDVEPIPNMNKLKYVRQAFVESQEKETKKQMFKKRQEVRMRLRQEERAQNRVARQERQGRADAAYQELIDKGYDVITLQLHPKNCLRFYNKLVKANDGQLPYAEQSTYS